MMSRPMPGVRKERNHDRTVQELYDFTRKKADPQKVEILLRPDGDEIAEVEFGKENGQVFAYLIAEGAIHM